MSESDAEAGGYSRLVALQNRKGKKAGGFQAFGLDQVVYKAVIKKGYKAPTPIQRKAIPLLLDGKDIVAMARTGSGKTAAFLLPLFQRLKCRNAKAGVRALLISPTRELALQTFKFFKELGKYTGLRATVLVGGDAMEEQFSAIHENPDVIIATPGRLLHVVVEMNLKLKSVEYVVFDEADRLFEIGFEEQLLDVLKRLPENRQTSLFSATLPKSLINFAKAGLNQPTLIRLDVDSTLSDQLKTFFIFCLSNDKLAVLMHLLRTVVDSGQQTIIFAATKHHIEYLRELLEKSDFSVSYLYSSLDAVARRQQIDAFRQRKTNLLLSTDIAARGVDIPLLDVTINFHFPPKAKLFIHRVGRVARAGRSGCAYSIITPEEMPYLVDLYLFLGRSLKIRRTGDQDSPDSDAVGSAPQMILDVEQEFIRGSHETSSELDNLNQVAVRAYQQYVRSRPTPSAESVKRVKAESMLKNIAVHPLFLDDNDDTTTPALENERAALLQGLKNYKPQITVFELGTSNKHESWKIMKAKRAIHGKRTVGDHHSTTTVDVSSNGSVVSKSENATEEDIQAGFTEVINSAFRLRDSVKEEKAKLKKEKSKWSRQKPTNPTKPSDLAKTKSIAPTDSKEYFVPYRPSDFHSERGLALEKNAFEKEAEAAVLDLTGDDEGGYKRKRSQMQWDRKKKKFVNVNDSSKGGPSRKKIRTESGVLIPATYKSDLYEKWKNKKGLHRRREDESDEEGGRRTDGSSFRRGRKGSWKNTSAGNGTGKGKRVKSELKKPETILKERKRKAAVESYQRHRREQKQHGRRGGKGGINQASGPKRTGGRMGSKSGGKRRK